MFSELNQLSTRRLKNTALVTLRCKVQLITFSKEGFHGATHASQEASFDHTVRRQYDSVSAGQARQYPGVRCAVQGQSKEVEINARTIIGGIRHDCAVVLLLALRGS